MNVKTVVIDKSEIDDCLVELLDDDFLAVEEEENSLLVFL
jgi:hypothetical protein